MVSPVYWAESALGEPFPKQDYSWARQWEQRSLLRTSAMAAVVAGSAVLGGAWYYLDSQPKVFYLVAAAPIASMSHGPLSAIQESTQLSRNPLDATPFEKRPAKPESSPSKRTPRSSSAATFEAPIVKPLPAPAPPSAAVTIAATHSDQVEILPVPRHVFKFSETKPRDIATSEQLGIREISADGIVLLSGKKVAIGALLPNREQILGIDATKGMVETDQRVLVIAPGRR